MYETRQHEKYSWMLFSRNSLKKNFLTEFFGLKWKLSYVEEWQKWYFVHVLLMQSPNLLFDNLVNL